MDKDDLSATNWFTSRLVAALLALTGIYFLCGAEAPGFDWLVKHWGGESHFYGFGLFIAFTVLAAQSFEKAQMRVQIAELLEAMHQLLYGKDYRRDREAIEILLAALESKDAENAKTAHAHLQRLTGQRFAQDPAVWRSWWVANKKAFSREKSGADAPSR
jgi:hypothetical protein